MLKIERIGNRMRRFFSAQRKEAIVSEVEQRLFRESVHRECRRADRTGASFCFVLFEIGVVHDRALVTHLRQILDERKRLTDEAGFYDAHRMGIILPYTTVEGAIRFGEDVCKRVGSVSQVVPTFAVYEYPSRWPFEDEGQSSADDDLVDDSSMPPQQTALKVDDDAHPPRRPVKRLHLLMHQRMPIWKRTLDLAVALTALVIFSPLLILIALHIKLVSPGPILFKQTRVGYLGSLFDLWKFRTMHHRASQDDHRHVATGFINDPSRPMTKMDLKGDTRLIPLAGTIRVLGLDELPQIFNVLRGEMSLVGPRPCIPYEARSYQRWHAQRFNAVPGITGLWQVSGKNRTTFATMVRLDVAYANANSLGLDLWIMLKTAPTVAYDAIVFGWARLRRAN